MGNTTAAGTTVITGGSLSLGSSEGIIYTNASTTTTFDTPITGSGGLTLSGTGTINFGGANNYTGQTALNGTSVGINSNTVFGTGTLTLTAGTITPASAVVLANPIVMNNGAITFGGTPQVTLTGGAQVTGLFNLITANTTGGVTFAAPIVDGTPPGATATVPGSISFSGSGTLFLAAANTYTGGTTLNVTTALISNNAAFGPGTLNIAGGSLATGGGTALGQSGLVHRQHADEQRVPDRQRHLRRLGPADLHPAGHARLERQRLVGGRDHADGQQLDDLLEPDHRAGHRPQPEPGWPGHSSPCWRANNSYSGGTTLATGTLGSAGTLVFPGSVTPDHPARHRDPRP